MSLPNKTENMLTAALAYATHGWPVFPLNGKVPAIRRRHPATIAYATTSCVESLVTVSNPLRECRGGCGHDGHGLYDATVDTEIVTGWWSNAYAEANIGGRVPPSMIVIDIDPRHGGDKTMAALEARYGALPANLTHYSGRGDGGKHLFFRRPPGDVSSRRLGSGIDLKTASGYVVLPPSIHPDSGLPYTRVDAPVAAPPRWLIDLLRPEFPTTRCSAGRKQGSRAPGTNPADTFCASTSWADILEPHGWQCLDYYPDDDGARWLHPDATSSCSATVRHGCLFVWSTNTPFEASEAGSAHGYTKFRAYAVLNHCGDMSAAAKNLIAGRKR
jgi:hypothetical protein